MVHTGGKEVAALRSEDVGFVADDADAIADRSRKRAAAFVERAHVSAGGSIVPDWSLR
jgi:hypothetical protein